MLCFCVTWNLKHKSFKLLRSLCSSLQLLGRILTKRFNFLLENNRRKWTEVWEKMGRCPIGQILRLGVTRYNSRSPSRKKRKMKTSNFFIRMVRHCLVSRHQVAQVGKLWRRSQTPGTTSIQMRVSSATAIKWLHIKYDLIFCGLQNETRSQTLRRAQRKATWATAWQTTTSTQGIPGGNENYHSFLLASLCLSHIAMQFIGSFSQTPRCYIRLWWPIKCEGLFVKIVSNKKASF